MRQHTPETTCPILPYTVKTVQRLYDDSAEYYIYLITVAAPDDSTTYYKTTQDVKTTFTAIHDKLEADRSKGLTKEFTFTKTMIESEPNTHYRIWWSRERTKWSS